MSELPFVSVIVPCRNERNTIRPCLESILANDYPSDRLEVLVVDGDSDDGTQSVVECFAEEYPFLKLLDNPKKTTPAAMNVGIAAARGAVIVRMDAHNKYPVDYISLLVGWLQKSEADNVGGLCITCPANETAKAHAIALGMSHRLGVGNAYFRVGVDEPRWVDTVPFGCYRREVFERIGTFDEELIRNQDDEFNLRLIRSGGRILLVPDVVSHYYARDSLRSLWRMFFQYGYFKPLVVRKIGAVMTARQVVPATLVVTLLVTGILGAWFPWVAGVLVGVLAVYLTAVLACCIAAVPKHGLRCALVLLLVFPIIHFSYGLGSLKGIVEFLVLRRSPRKDARAVPLSR